MLLYYIGGYGIDLSKIENVAENTDLLSQKLLEHGVTVFCPTIISIDSGYDKVSVFNYTTIIDVMLGNLGNQRSEPAKGRVNWSRNYRSVEMWIS